VLPFFLSVCFIALTMINNTDESFSQKMII